MFVALSQIQVEGRMGLMIQLHQTAIDIPVDLLDFSPPGISSTVSVRLGRLFLLLQMDY
jgi:hypothetical protein